MNNLTFKDLVKTRDELNQEIRDRCLHHKIILEDRGGARCFTCRKVIHEENEIFPKGTVIRLEIDEYTPAEHYRLVKDSNLYDMEKNSVSISRANFNRIVVKGN